MRKMSESGSLPHCNHFVIRKKRYCRMPVNPGDKFCGEHQPIQSPDLGGPDNDKKVRIVCPLDSKHTCYAHNLKKHLKICNARPGVEVPYIQKGVNSGKERSDVDTHKLLSEFTTGEITGVIEKINRIYDEMLMNKITSNLAKHPVVEEEMAKPEYGDKSKKHLKQASAILGLLQEYDLLKPKTCFVEFGAGRGQLSYWLAQAVDSSFLLIERSSPKHKRDNKLDKTEDKVQRIRADICDLVLDKIDSASKSSSIVGITKHLCGDATDLALRCLANFPDHNLKVSGCVMTFCCHHRCRWMAYTGKAFFKKIGLEKNDFDMMCGMSSWATCGTGYSRGRKEEDDNGIWNERDKEIGLNRSQKEEMGRKCKSIMDYGRLKFLEDLGFECRLHFYVEREVSLENVCIVAYRKQK